MQDKRLRVKPEHIKVLTSMVVPLFSEELERKYADAGHTERRYLFDRFWAASRAHPTEMNDLMKEIYAYANDDHLVSALRSLNSAYKKGVVQ